MIIEEYPRWLRVREAARLLSVSESTVRLWLLVGRIDGFKVDGVVRVDRHSIEGLIIEHGYADVRKAEKRSRLLRLLRRRRQRELAS